MKEIKFRASIEGCGNKLFEVEEIDFVRKHIVVKELPCSYYPFKDVKFYQFTGRVDRNNIDIYEGHKVMETRYRDFDYKEINTITTSIIEDIRDLSFGVLDEDYENSYDLEVLGHIVTNPELLEE